MRRVKYWLTAIGLGAMLAAPVAAIEPEETGECTRESSQQRLKEQAREQEPLFGEALMSKEERATLRKRLAEAANDEAREQLRAEHRELIQKRAQEQGVEVPATMEREWARKMDPDCEEAGEPVLRRQMPKPVKGQAQGKQRGNG